VKPIVWCGDSLRRLRDFPQDARRESGHQLNRVQQGREPKDWKPISTVGPGVREIRIHQAGEFRVLYLANLPEAVYVLSAFEKEDAQDTAKRARPGRGPVSYGCGGAQETATMKRRMKMVRGRGNVFRDLGFREPEARNLALRSEIMIRIEEFVERSGMTQARAAARLGLTQPRLNALLKGKIDQFSLDALVNAATRAGLQVDLLVTTRKRTAERAAANA
jgi:phage-related protein/predicted XRE-type DNA-binding protein